MVPIEVRSITKNFMLRRYRYHFQETCWRVDLKRASRLLDF
jgi:hypothetical protein